MRRALLVSASAKPGGAERAAAALAGALPAHGWELVPVFLEDGEALSWFAQEPTVLEAGRTRELHRTAATIRRLARLARRSGAEAVLSCHSRSHVYGGLAARLTGLPGIWWQHEIPRRSPVNRAAAAVPAALVVCVSEAAAAAQRDLWPQIPVAVVHSSAPPPVVEPDAGRRLRTSLGWTDGPVVGIVGRLEPIKGQDVFLRAAALIAEQRPEARFAVVGGAVLGWEGDYPQGLETLAAELGLGERVVFTGHQTDVGPWLDALDVVVQTSREESLGLVLLEAMSLGKPVVTAAAGGSREVVEDGRSGLVAESRTPEAVARAVVRLLDDPELAATLVAGGFERAERFSPERAAAAFAAVLERVAARAGSPRSLAEARR